MLLDSTPEDNAPETPEAPIFSAWGRERVVDEPFCPWRRLPCDGTYDGANKAEIDYLAPLFSCPSPDEDTSIIAQEREALIVVGNGPPPAGAEGDVSASIGYPLIESVNY